MSEQDAQFIKTGHDWLTTRDALATALVDLYLVANRPSAKPLAERYAGAILARLAGNEPHILFEVQRDNGDLS